MCEPDAHAAAEKWLDKHPRYRFQVVSVEPVTHKLRKARGRPKSDEPVTIEYHISAKLEINPDSIQKEKQKLGRFILATNVLSISPDLLLQYYKNQGTVERGFRFLKDKSFKVAEVFLKKNSRIQALAMIMVLCLFIYSMVEFRLRRDLKKSGETVMGQTNKPTQKPTLKWVFFQYRRVREYAIVNEETRHIEVANLSGDLRKTLGLLGPPYEKYYF